MQLIKQLLDKKLELYDDLFCVRRNYLRGMWLFFSAYRMSLSVSKEKDLLIPHINMLMKNFIKNPESIDSFRFIELKKHQSQRLNSVLNAINTINEKRVEGELIGDLYVEDEGMVFMFVYEHPMDFDEF